MENNIKRKKVALLGSTGSIGKSSVKILKRLKAQFQVTLLVANKNYELIAQQAVELNCPEIVLTDCQYLENLRPLVPQSIKISSDYKRIEEVVASDSVDILICAIIGTAGFLPVLSAIRSGKRVGLASKEVMVMAGELINRELEKNPQSAIIPIDSEHSALFQCLENRAKKSVKNLILTSSGGAFVNYSAEEIKHVTVAQALNHPVWNMGNKITIDSASMMNKALEVIEAHHLFNIEGEKIKVIIHKEAIIHSMVEFIDNTNIALLSNPSMELPIQHALTYPNMCSSDIASLDLAKLKSLTFQEVNQDIFPSLEFAYQVIKQGGTAGAILNAANEVAVEHFYQNKLDFCQIWNIVSKTLEKCEVLSQNSLENILQSDREARRVANELIKK